MTPWECEFESDVLCAVQQERWPERTDADLVAHVANCAVCSDLVVIAEAIEAGCEEIGAPAAIPESGRVWWLAQRRARLEAAEIANRPLQATQMIAFVCAVALFCLCLGPIRSRFLTALGRVTSGSGTIDIGAWLTAATTLLAEHAGLALAMVAVLLVIPVAAYLAIGRE